MGRVHNELTRRGIDAGISEGVGEGNKFSQQENQSPHKYRDVDVDRLDSMKR